MRHQSRELRYLQEYSRKTPKTVLDLGELAKGREFYHTPRNAFVLACNCRRFRIVDNSLLDPPLDHPRYVMSYHGSDLEGRVTLLFDSEEDPAGQPVYRQIGDGDIERFTFDEFLTGIGANSLMKTTFSKPEEKEHEESPVENRGRGLGSRFRAFLARRSGGSV